MAIILNETANHANFVKSVCLSSCKSYSCIKLKRAILVTVLFLLPVPVAARSKAWVCGRLPAEIVGSNPTGGMDVCCECCVLSGSGLCVLLLCALERIRQGGD